MFLQKGIRRVEISKAVVQKWKQNCVMQKKETGHRGWVAEKGRRSSTGYASEQEVPENDGGLQRKQVGPTGKKEKKKKSLNRESKELARACSIKE